MNPVGRQGRGRQANSLPAYVPDRCAHVVGFRAAVHIETLACFYLIAGDMPRGCQPLEDRLSRTQRNSAQQNHNKTQHRRHERAFDALPAQLNGRQERPEVQARIYLCLTEMVISSWNI